jgi:hypothetical protein
VLLAGGLSVAGLLLLLLLPLQALHMVKPSTADPQAMRHSMPALPYAAGSSSGSNSHSPSMKQARTRVLQQQQQFAGGLLPSLGLFEQSRRNSPGPGSGAGASPYSPYGSSRQAWPAFATPPRSVVGAAPRGSKSAARLSQGLQAGRLLDADASLGPSSGAHLFAGSLRQDMYCQGASGLKGVQPERGAGGLAACG